MQKTVLLLLLLASVQGFCQTAADYFKKAETAFKAEKYSPALQSVDKAIAMDSLNESYYVLRARCHWRLKKYDAAMGIISGAIFRFPESFALYNARGLFLYSAKNFEPALADFKTALSLAKNDSLKLEALQNCSSARLGFRDFSGCYQDLMTGYAIDSNHVGILTNLGVVCDEIGRGNETLKYLHRLIAIDSANVNGYVNIGYKYVVMERFTKAITYFDKAISLDPECAYAYSNRAYSKLMSGDTKGALKDVNKSIQLNPANSYAFRNRALIYLKMDKREKACDDIQTALDRNFTGQYGNEVKQLKRDYCPPSR